MYKKRMKKMNLLSSVVGAIALWCAVVSRVCSFSAMMKVGSRARRKRTDQSIARRGHCTQRYCAFAAIEPTSTTTSKEIPHVDTAA